jgi:hypothetical protein
MTPSGPHPYAAFAGGGAPAPGDQGLGRDRSDLPRQVRAGVIVAVAATVAGVLLGLLWLWLAPRVPLVSDGKAVYLKDGEGEQSIGVDGWFTLLGAGFGVLSAVLVYLRHRAGGVAVVFGLAVGGVLGSIVAWRLGIALGPTSNIVAHAKAVGANKTFDAPLKLRAKGALLAWPALAMATQLVLTAAFTPREPQRPVTYPWAQWGAPQPPQGQPPQDGPQRDPFQAPRPDGPTPPEQGPNLRKDPPQDPDQQQP